MFRGKGASERSCFAFCILGAARCCVVIVFAVARRLRPAKNSQRRHNDLSHRLRRTFPILEVPGLQSPFDKDYGPFRHKLFGDLRQLVPSDAADPFHALISVFLVAEWLIDGEREIRDRFTGRCGFHLCVLPGILEENDFVYSDTGHLLPPFAQKFRKVAMKRGIGEKWFYGSNNVPTLLGVGVVTYANLNCPINCRSSTVREVDDARK